MVDGTECAPEEADVTKWPLLESLAPIHSIVFYDLFEDGSREREVEELRAAAKTKYHELGVSRSTETWELVSSMLPFLPNKARTCVPAR